MDVWIEFKNASKWQAEALFRNFFPSAVEDENGDILLEGELEGVDLPCPPPPPPPPSSSSLPQSPASESLPSALWSLSPSFASSSSSLSSPPSSVSNNNNNNNGGGGHKRVASLPSPPPPKSDEFGAKNKAYMPPPVDEDNANRHSAKPLDAATLNVLAKQFADSIPDDEFSVAALQGCKLNRNYDSNVAF
jgi:mitochondrial chaperone BCS1